MPAIGRSRMKDQFSEVLVIGGSRSQFDALKALMKQQGLGEPVTVDRLAAESSASGGIRRVYVLGSGLDYRQTIDLLDELRRRSSRAPAVVLRENGEREFLIECFRHGAVEVLSGPVTAPDWCSRLGCWLNPRPVPRSVRRH